MKICMDCINYDGWGYCQQAGKKIPSGEIRALNSRTEGPCKMEAGFYSRKWWKFWRPK